MFPQALGPGDRDDFIEACVQAAVRWDVNAFYLVETAQIESGIRNIGTPGSDAFGPFQIREATWEDLRGESGFSTADRSDPFKQPFVAGNIAARGIKALRPILPDERMPTNAELYLTHLFGERGGTTVLSGSRSDSIEAALTRVFPTKPDRVAAILKANSSLLNDDVGGGVLRPRTVNGVLNEVDKRLTDARKLVLPDGIIEVVEPQLQGELVARAVEGNTTYWVLNKFDEHGGGQFLLKQVGAGQPDVIRSDTVVFPLSPPLVPQEVADILNKAFEGPPPPPAGGGPPIQPGGNTNELVLDKAVDNDDRLITREVKDTKNGTLACAWAVNQIVRLALGKPIEGGRNNGLSTRNMAAALRARHILKPVGQIAPGMVIISPTAAKVGHVGFVGRLNANRDNTPILSNSSKFGRFSHLFTLRSWNAHYRGTQGLEVLFYELNRRNL